MRKKSAIEAKQRILLEDNHNLYKIKNTSPYYTDKPKDSSVSTLPYSHRWCPSAHLQAHFSCSQE